MASEGSSLLSGALSFFGDNSAANEVKSASNDALTLLIAA